jgi:hypothetical protein
VPKNIYNQKGEIKMSLALSDLQIRQLNNMNAAAQRSQLGSILGVLGPVGDVYYLDPANGDDDNSGTSPASAVQSMETAYDLLTGNQNDVLVYIAGATSLTLQEALVWNKSYTHFVGYCAPTRVAQRARIFQLASLTAASPLITISGSGCMFENFYVFQGVDDATSLINVSVSGSRNYFKNVHFAGGGHATQAIDGGASLRISGGSENTFVDCTIGVDTIAAGNGMAGLVFAATGGAARNRFIDCDFTLWAGNAGAIFVEVLGNSGLDRYQIFKNCTFSNLSSTALTQAFAIAADFDPANKRLLLKDCTLIGAPKWDNADRGAVYGNMNAVTGADLSGVMVQMIT